MKILGLSCSPRKRGNTVILLEEVLKGAAHAGAETELISVSGMDIRGCDGCYACISKGECHIKDDMDVIHRKFVEADGIVFGVPIYFYGMSAQAKTVIDRSFSLNRPDRSLMNKVGSVVTVAGSLGLIDALKDFYFYFAVRRMLPANFLAAYANKKGEVTELKQGLKAAFNLGKEMVLLANKKFEFPKESPPNFFAYGTHTH